MRWKSESASKRIKCICYGPVMRTMNPVLLIDSLLQQPLSGRARYNSRPARNESRLCGKTKTLALQQIGHVPSGFGPNAWPRAGEKC